MLEFEHANDNDDTDRNNLDMFPFQPIVSYVSFMIWQTITTLSQQHPWFYVL